MFSASLAPSLWFSFVVLGASVVVVATPTGGTPGAGISVQAFRFFGKISGLHRHPYTAITPPYPTSTPPKYTNVPYGFLSGVLQCTVSKNPQRSIVSPCHSIGNPVEG